MFIRDTEMHRITTFCLQFYLKQQGLETQVHQLLKTLTFRFRESYYTAL